MSEDMEKLIAEAVARNDLKEFLDEVSKHSTTAIASATRLPKPTIERWKSGKNVPHILMLKGIIRTLRAMNYPKYEKEKL